MRTHLITSSFFLFVFSLGAASDAPWCFLLFFLPLLFTAGGWLVPGGFAWRRHYHSGSTIPPGPSGWPVLGSLASATGPLAHRKLAALARSHGAGRLMSLSLGAKPAVVSSHPDTAREILHGSAFADRPARAAARLLMFERAVGFAPGGGEHWRSLRRVAAASMFSPRRVAALAGVRRRAAGRMEGRVWSEMEGEGEVTVRGAVQRAALESMVESVFGDDGGEREALMEMVREGYELIGEFNLEDYLPLGGVFDFHGVGRRCRRLASRVTELLGRIMKRRRSRLCFTHKEEEEEEEEEECFLDVLLNLPEEERLCDADITAVLWEMVFRGTDAVAILLEWILARAVLHPEIQAKAQEELDAVAGSRPVDDADVPSLRYLQAVTKEVLRRHPPAPLLSWARLAVRDVHVGKHFVPAGTTAMVNMWAIAHDESLWPEPWAFRPERFLDGGEHRDVSPLGADLRLAPFGSGRRVCPGRSLALATVHLWAARLLQRFRWTAARPVSLAERLRLSLEMKKPLVCRVELLRSHAM